MGLGAAAAAGAGAGSLTRAAGLALGRELPDAAGDAVGTESDKCQSPLSAVALEYYGGAASRVPSAATAFPHRASIYNLIVLGQWREAAEDRIHMGWARDLWDAVQPWASGAVFMNALGDDASPNAVREAYGANVAAKVGRAMELDDDTLSYLEQRLKEIGVIAALKAAVDPKNLFRLNQNIAPAA